MAYQEQGARKYRMMQLVELPNGKMRQTQMFIIPEGTMKIYLKRQMKGELDYEYYFLPLTAPKNEGVVIDLKTRKVISKVA